VAFQAAAGVIDRQSAGDQANFYQKLAQLAGALSGT